jgi:hypothetical protein
VSGAPTGRHVLVLALVPVSEGTLVDPTNMWPEHLGAFIQAGEIATAEVRLTGHWSDAGAIMEQAEVLGRTLEMILEDKEETP